MTKQTKQGEVKAIVNKNGDSGGCWHLRAVKGKKDYYCPDCFLRGELYEENGKRMFKKWREV